MRRMTLVIAAGVALVMGCVNIPKKFEAHITVDIRHHIEEQAVSTLDFIEGKTDALAEPKAAPDQDGKKDKGSRLREGIKRLWPVQAAYAAELKSSSPEISRLATELRKRFDQVQALKAKGFAGESNRGYLELRNAEKIARPEERNEAQRLIAAENADRKALYQEVARLNADQKASVSMVESVYATERLQRAKPGEIFQLPEGDAFATFQKTDAGKRQGRDAAPGAWVVIK